MTRLIVTGILLCFLGGCDLVDYYNSTGEVVFVTPGVLNMREGPSAKHLVVRRLERGQELAVVKREAKWVRVRLSDRLEGWVHGDYVGTPADVRARLERDLKRRSPTRSSGSVPKRSSLPRATTAHIGLSIDDLIGGLTVPLSIEQLDAMDGTERRVGVGGQGHLMAEFWGDSENLERATLIVKVGDIDEADLDRNASSAFAFVQNAMPKLRKDVDWMRNKLIELSSRDIGEGALKTSRRQVSFHFLKALGSVRITVELPEA